MNKSDVQGSPQSAAPTQDQTPTPKESGVSRTGTQSRALPSDHVCTDAYTHEGATKGESTSPAAPGAGKMQPAAAKGGSDSTARGS